MQGWPCCVVSLDAPDQAPSCESPSLALVTLQTHSIGLPSYILSPPSTCYLTFPHVHNQAYFPLLSMPLPTSSPSRLSFLSSTRTMPHYVVAKPTRAMSLLLLAAALVLTLHEETELDILPSSRTRPAEIPRG